MSICKVEVISLRGRGYIPAAGYQTLCCALHYASKLGLYPRLVHFITLASSVDRDVTGGPVGRNWFDQWFQTLNLSFTFYIYKWPALICGQGCNWWSRRPKLISSVISDIKPIIYILHLQVTGKVHFVVNLSSRKLLIRPVHQLVLTVNGAIFPPRIFRVTSYLPALKKNWYLTFELSWCWSAGQTNSEQSLDY